MLPQHEENGIGGDPTPESLEQFSKVDTSGMSGLPLALGGVHAAVGIGRVLSTKERFPSGKRPRSVCDRVA